MARVFIAMYNFGRDKRNFYQMPPFLEAFVYGFKKNGNEVLCYQHKTYDRAFENPIPEEYKTQLEKFKPDLCILFCNNFWDISEMVDCPIIIYDIDSILEYKGVENLRNNIGRYLFVVNQRAAFETLKEHLGVTEKQVCYVPFFTEINSDNNNLFSHDINFLGTNWLWKGCDFALPFSNSAPSFIDKGIAKKTLTEFIKTPFNTPVEIINKNGWHPQIPLNVSDLKRASVEISGLRRLKYLTKIADLDLEIRGTYWNIDCMKYFPEVTMCFNPQVTVSLDENEKFYNSAKISLNTRHIQAQNGFSFRVCDIMSSNACLVTEYCQDLKTLFPKVPIPMFTSDVELREQCLRLLNNENLRREIVEASHEAIEKKHRFKHILRILEEFTGRTLHENGEGSIEFFSDEDVEKEENILKSQKTLPQKLLFHLGYGEEYKNITHSLHIGKLDVVRYIKNIDGAFDTYLFFLPLLRFSPSPVGREIKVLALEKVKTAIRLIKENDFLYLKKMCLKPKHYMNRQKLKRKWKLGKKISVVLFVSRINCWLFEDLYQILLKSGHFMPIIVIKPFVSQGEEAMIRYQEQTYEELTKKGFSPIRGYDLETDTFLDIRKELNPDIVFYTKFWKPHFHPNFYIDKFLDKLTFLTPYGFYVAEDRRAMNFELNNLVDGFFLETPFHKMMAERDMRNHGKNVYITGAPKLDVFFGENKTKNNVWKHQEKEKKKIIWAPHHEDKTAIWMYQFDAFYEIADFMLEVAEKYSDKVQFAFKPHPMLKEKLYNRWGKENTDKYYNEWMYRNNCQLEEGEFEELFLQSDAMILDSISFIAEYTAVNKPALFTVGRKARVFLNEYGMENYKVLYEAKSDLKKEICQFIENVVINENDYKLNDRTEFMKKNLLPPSGKTASQNIYDCMCKEILR